MAISPTASNLTNQLVLQQSQPFSPLLSPSQPPPDATQLFTNLLATINQARQAAAQPPATTAPTNGGLTVTGGAGIVSNVSGIPGVTQGLADITEITTMASAGQLMGAATITSGTVLQGGGILTIVGPGGAASINTSANETVATLIQAVNATNIGVTATFSATGKLQLTTSSVGSGQTVAISVASGNDVTTMLGLTAGTNAGADATATVNGVAATGRGNQFQVGGSLAGDLTGLSFTASGLGSTQVSIFPTPFNLDGAQAQVLAPPTTQPQFNPNDLAAASNQLLNALVLQQFSLFALQQQSAAFGLQSSFLL